MPGQARGPQARSRHQAPHQAQEAGASVSLILPLKNDTKQEVTDLRCQFGTSSWGGRRYLPLVFTQEGVAMLSSVLNSKRAVTVNILIMRAFVKLKELLLTHKDLALKINALERKYVEHDERIKEIFDAIRRLIQIGRAHV